MRSAKSFFEPTLYKKDLLRFWPLWAIYTVFWLFQLPVPLLNRLDWSSQESILSWILRMPLRSVSGEEGIILAFGYGVVCATAVWFYLYNHRSANLMHSLPLQREGHFLTRIATGVTMFVLPHMFILLVTVLVELGAGFGLLGLSAMLQWALYQTLMCLFFFALATLCAMFTGHILALPAFYVIANFFFLVMFGLLDWLSSYFLYGYSSGLAESAVSMLLTPFVCLSGSLGCEQTKDVIVTLNPDVTAQAYHLTGTAGPWVYAALAIVLLAVALLFFRKRHMESAGDVVAVPFLRPVFCYGLALCGGLFGGCLIYELMSYNGLGALVFWLLLWTAVAFFAGKMLLEKSFRVFRGSLKGCAAVLAVMLVFVGVLHFDLFGVETRVPDADRVVSVRVDGYETAPADSGSWLNVGDVTDPEAIAKIIAVHQTIADNLDYIQRLEKNSGYWYENEGVVKGAVVRSRFEVTYTLKSGATLSRSYYTLWLEYDRLSDPDSLESCYSRMLNDPTIRKNAYDVKTLEDAFTMEIQIQYGTTFYTEYGYDYYYPDKVIEDMDYYLSMGYTEEEVLSGEIVDFETAYEKESLTASQTAALRTAILADLESGNLGSRYLFRIDPALHSQVLAVNLCLSVPVTETYTDYDGKPAYSTYHRNITIALTTRATATLQVLRDLGLLQYDLYTCGGNLFTLP